MRVHIQTVINSNFALLDEDNNLVDPKPMQITIQEFSERAFIDAYRKLRNERDKAVPDKPEKPVNKRGK